MSQDQSLRPDIAAAADRMDVKTGAKREIVKLVEYLWEGELVQHMAAGNYGGGIGLVALTDRRLMFVKDGWVGKTSEDFPLDKISSVQWSSGMLTGTLTVFASGNKAAIGNMSKAGGKIIADTIRERLASGPPPVPQQTAPAAAPASAAQEDVLETLRKLGELRDAGVVTSGEFEAKKAELLRRI